VQHSKAPSTERRSVHGGANRSAVDPATGSGGMSFGMVRDTSQKLKNVEKLRNSSDNLSSNRIPK
jgi:hypothetical protein